MFNIISIEKPADDLSRIHRSD